MKFLLAFLCPPLAACRYGCAGCCAAPIAVFWLAGLVAIGYGFAGGPANLMGTSWNTIAFGSLLWLIAAVWSVLTMRGVEHGKCEPRYPYGLCGRAVPPSEEADPFDEVRKAR